MLKKGNNVYSAMKCSVFCNLPFRKDYKQSKKICFKGSYWEKYE